jgi:ADP-heptose:LPS heptosyltransferase
MTLGRSIPAQRILVFMPNPLGDAVMATPLLKALRILYPQSQISAIGGRLAQAVLSGLPIVDESLQYCLSDDGTSIDAAATVSLLKKLKFDLAVLLPNNFRTAILAHRAGIPHRLGYARDGRRFLLTDFLRPSRRSDDETQLQWARNKAIEFITAEKRQGNPAAAQSEVLAVTPDPDQPDQWIFTVQQPNGSVTTTTARMSSIERFAARWHNYQPTPAIDYYMALAHYLGSRYHQRKMILGITPTERQQALDALAQLEVFEGQPFVILVPGASFGSSKCWPIENFAQITATLINPDGPFKTRVLIAAAPAEQPLVDALLKRTAITAGRFFSPHLTPLRRPVVPLSLVHDGRGVALGALKEIVRRANVMLCNDTGPRHFAAALATPLVSLFGPTDPRWADVFYDREIQLHVAVPCGPCQRKHCPIDHRCMNRLTVPMVQAALLRQWGMARP